ncbi:MAG: hypothetical protein LBG83_08760 [Oscillospiraceae bacterium]|jgi:hypothetical protein|nr:hypothetical protein [Oscillospiraceae bacterium]
MKLTMIAPQVLDIAANEQAIAYARRDTKADGSVFASFHFCDWETLQTRPIAESTYLYIKFGDAGAHAAQALGEPFGCRAAPLPDGGCAVLTPGGLLRLFRPDGARGGGFVLDYQECPACDIVSVGGDIWFTATEKNALVLFSLARRGMVLRVGGEGVFPRPTGLSAHGNLLCACCAGGVKALALPSYELGDSIAFEGGEAPDRFFQVFRRRFVGAYGGLYALSD